jgi:hypothetical protein
MNSTRVITEHAAALGASPLPLSEPVESRAAPIEIVAIMQLLDFLGQFTVSHHAPNEAKIKLLK